MAIVLSLKRGATTLDLTDAFKLDEGGWLSAVATPVYMGDPPPVVEVLNLILNDSSHDAIATEMQSLHQMQVWADQYINARIAFDPVWLHAKMNNETGERRSLVYKIDVQYGASYFGTESVALSIPVTITVTRSPYWERTAARNLPDLTPSAGAIVTYDYTAAGTGVTAHNIVGDAPARLGRFIFGGVGGDFLHVFWMGIRSINLRESGEVINFDPLWELEDGTNQTDVSDTVDATASGGDRITVAESSNNWDDEWNAISLITLLQGAGGVHLDDQNGDFLWLLRCKVASGTWEFELRFGATGVNDEDYIRGPIVEVTETTWTFKEAGVGTIPYTNPRALDWTNFDSTTSVKIWGRRTSGSGNFHLDCLCLIPIDEGFLKYTGTDIAGSDYVELGQDVRGVWASDIGGGDGAGSIHSLQNFALPPGNGRLYCVYADTFAGGDITDQVTFNPTPANSEYYERWLSLRGGE